MKLYTGPTLTGGTMTITCPPWCVSDHRMNGRPEPADDTVHFSDRIMIVPPADPHRGDEYAVVPQMEAFMMQHSTDPDPECGPMIYVRLEDIGDRAAHMDPAQADDLIAQLEEYIAGLRRMRDHLAATLVAGQAQRT